MSPPFLRPILRAAPRVLVTAVWVTAAWTVNQGWYQAATILLAVMCFVSLFSASWWHYVRTGEKSRRPVAPEFRQPGTHRVELLDRGSKDIYLLKALREVRDLSLAEAKELAGVVPAPVAQGLSRESAQAVAERISDAGGRPKIVDAGANL